MTFDVDAELRRIHIVTAAQVVAEDDGRPVTRAELSALFDKVADKAHWKNQIDAEVVLAPAQLSMMFEAVVFFTGSVPDVTYLADVPGGLRRYRVKAAGYFATCGA